MERQAFQREFSVLPRSRINGHASDITVCYIEADYTQFCHSQKYYRQKYRSQLGWTTRYFQSSQGSPKLPRQVLVEHNVEPTPSLPPQTPLSPPSLSPYASCIRKSIALSGLPLQEGSSIVQPSRSRERKGSIRPRCPPRFPSASLLNTPLICTSSQRLEKRPRQLFR